MPIRTFGDIRLTNPIFICDAPASRDCAVHFASLNELFLSSEASTALKFRQEGDEQNEVRRGGMSQIIQNHSNSPCLAVYLIPPVDGGSRSSGGGGGGAAIARIELVQCEGGLSKC